VSPTQINMIVDPSVPVGIDDVAIVSPTAAIEASVTVQAATASGIFTIGETGSGDGAILNSVTNTAWAFSTATNGQQTYLELFVTGLAASPLPTVFVGGIPVSPSYAGPQSQYAGLEQINVQVPPSLAGAGRLEVVVQQGTYRSNAAEIVMLPNQAVFPNDLPNQKRSRELTAVAWVPGTSLALVADQNDDVVRVVDLQQRRVTHVIALPGGAQPVAIGVHGNNAVVAERGRGSIAVLDLTKFNVVDEFATGASPSAVAIAGDDAIIVNSDADTASFFTFTEPFGPQFQITSTVPTGRLPRAVAADSTKAYVTNQSAGTITILDLANRTVSGTFKLGDDVRPGAIQVYGDVGVIAVAEQTAGPGGKVYFLQSANGVFTSISANPDLSGGASAMVSNGDRVYLANEAAGTITTSLVSALPGGPLQPSQVVWNPANFPVDSGPHSLSLDTADNLLLTASEGPGTITLTGLASNGLAGRIDAMRSSPSDNIDDHSDRFNAPNRPSISAIAPSSAAPGQFGTTVNITIAGTNLTNAEAILFLDPAAVPGLLPGTGDVNRSNFGVNDSNFIVTNLQASADGTTVTATVQIAARTPNETRVIRVLTPNGETSLTSALTFSIVGQ
ncbi:MAG: hypothetical protein ACRD30_04985, partial [Bryobacteraceae bacterium]